MQEFLGLTQKNKIKVIVILIVDLIVSHVKVNLARFQNKNTVFQPIKKVFPKFLQQENSM